MSGGQTPADRDCQYGWDKAVAKGGRSKRRVNNRGLIGIAPHFLKGNSKWNAFPYGKRSARSFRNQGIFVEKKSRLKKSTEKNKTPQGNSILKLDG